MATGDETGKIIRLMAADMEAKKTIREYKGNDTLLGKVRVMEANRARFETAGFYAELLRDSMKAVRVASKKLKTALAAGGFKNGDRFSKRMDKIMTKFEQQQDQFDETLGELDMVTGYLNNNNKGSDSSDSDDNDYSGTTPFEVSSLLCSVPTHSLGDLSDDSREKGKTACFE
jgi:hypothetical protein